MKSIIQEYFDGTDKVSKSIIKEGDVVVSECKYNLNGVVIESVDYYPSGKLKSSVKRNDNGSLHGYRCIEKYNDKGSLTRFRSYTNGILGWNNNDDSISNYMETDENGAAYAVILTSGEIISYREYDSHTCLKSFIADGKFTGDRDYKLYIKGDMIEKRKNINNSNKVKDCTISTIITMLSSATKEYSNEVLSVYKSEDKTIIIEGDTLRWK